MKINADPKSEHYWQRYFKESPKIYLDGVLQPKVTLADDAEGYVVRCVLDGAGSCQIDPNKPDEIWTEQVWGKVEIRTEIAAL